MDKLMSHAINWQRQLKTATDLDRWGQPVEASATYQRLSTQISCAVVDKNLPITPEQKQLCGVLIVNLDRRIKLLQNPQLNDKDSVSLDKLSSFLIKLENFSILPNGDAASKREYNSCVMTHDMSLSLQGSLLPQPTRQVGKTYLTIKIDKIGLKDAIVYDEPFFTVSCKDRMGCDLAPVQNTPPSSVVQNLYVIFDVNVHLQNCLEELPNDFAIFFEFRHFKAHKQMISTKCFSFLEKDEIANGCIALELYKKPTDVFRHRLRLLSRKPLFLHLSLTVTPPI